MLNEALSQQPKATLYHYTTQSGLLGIITNREIWATHNQYLNDAREYRHAVEMVMHEIKARLADAVGDAYRILDDMQEGMKSAESANVCVCSFSEDRDSLSQWRAYGGSTSGFAIGINPVHLLEIVKREKFYLAPRGGKLWSVFCWCLVPFNSMTSAAAIASRP